MLVICIQKVLTGAFKLKPTTDVRIPITRTILHKLLDSLQRTISKLFDSIPSNILISRLWLFENRGNYIQLNRSQQTSATF